MTQNSKFQENRVATQKVEKKALKDDETSRNIENIPAQPENTKKLKKIDENGHNTRKY